MANSSVNLEFQRPDNSTVAFSAIKVPASITAPTYSLAYFAQSSYPVLTFNQTRVVTEQYRNTGNQIWYDDVGLTSASTRNPKAVHLATAQPLNHLSGFAVDWPSGNRPALNFAAVYEANGTTLAANQHAAQPGQVVKYQFNVSPFSYTTPGVYREFYQPIIEGSYDGGLNFAWTFQDINNIAPAYIAAYKDQSAYPVASRGGTSSVFFRYQNNGNTPWFDDTSLSQATAGTKPMHLSTSHNLNRASRFSHSSWPSANRPAVNFSAVYEANGTTLAANQHVVQPGQIAKYSFTMSVPGDTPNGSYREFFQPIIEGSYDGAFADPWTFLDLTVQ